MSPTPVYALADGNNFYVSCERVFQPDLRHRPAVVLSNNDGCAIARSPEAKAMGIAMGEPWFKIKQRPDGQRVAVRSANFTLYGDMSRRMMDIFADHAPRIEIYSIDECFLDLTGMSGDLSAYGADLRAKVGQWTGLPVSIGFGPTKTLAKLANHKAKKTPGGVFDLHPPAIRQQALAQTPVGDLWGIGRRWSRRLEFMGIHSAADLARMDRGQARRMMGVVGLRTVDELNGIPCIELEDVTPDKQTLCVSRSFGDTINDWEGLADRMRFFAARAAEKARRHGLVAGLVSVFVRGNRFRRDLPQYANGVTLGLRPATADTGIIMQTALRGLHHIHRPGIPYKKAGILLLELEKESAVRRDLFSFTEPRRNHLMQTMDILNTRFGPGAVSYGQLPQPRTWYMRQEHRSPRFTTHWDELMQVR